MSRIKLCGLDDFEQKNCIRAEYPNEQNKSIIVIQNNEKYYAYENICPHFSVQMDHQKGVFHTYKNQLLMCAHHAAMFDIVTGECIDGPCKGHSLKAVPIELKDGEIFLKS